MPVGTVISWYPPSTAFTVDPNDQGGPKTLKYPSGFALCDGSVVADPESPFNGQALPDLRNRFVLGANNGVGPGTRGGYDVGTGWQNPMFITSPTVAGSQDDVPNDIIQNQTPTAAWRYVLHVDDGMNDGNHHHYVAADSFTVPAPGYVALIPIIRIK